MIGFLLFLVNKHQEGLMVTLWATLGLLNYIILVWWNYEYFKTRNNGRVPDALFCSLISALMLMVFEWLAFVFIVLLKEVLLHVKKDIEISYQEYKKLNTQEQV